MSKRYTTMPKCHIVCPSVKPDPDDVYLSFNSLILNEMWLTLMIRGAES